MKPRYDLHVTLDENATILDIQCRNILAHTSLKEYVGKNWFLEFIDKCDFNEMIKVFKEMLQGEEDKLKTHRNRLHWIDGSDRYFRFDNRLEVIDGKRVIRSSAKLCTCRNWRH